VGRRKERRAMSLPRPEYPRPQFVRDQWLCLNGQWEFEVDAGDSGLERGLRDRKLAGEITVPFCPESVLSGVGNVDFLNAVWYRRAVEIPAEWAGRRVLLHFQAVDYDATVWVNGAEVARHQGGCVGFTCDLGGVAEAGTTAEIVVRARDDSRGAIPRGKQCPEYHSRGCDYTRTTGIWQTVWMEPEPMVALRRPRITPDVANSRFILEQPIYGRKAGHSVRALLSIGGATVSSVTVPADRDMTPILTLPITADHVRLWAPGEPNLYDLEIELLGPDAEVVDSARSYAGLRSVVIDDKAVKISGKPVFQRLVLDQGYYPDGILTAPSDEALVADIVLSMEAGFNGARLHQKVFEERFLYHADRLGYLVWGEFADWGMDRGRPQATYVAQWLEALHRDVSHPAIVGWCGLNETHERITDRISGLDGLTQAFYLAAKAMDTSRPVLDASGYSHRIADADISDSHDYDQEPATFKARHDALLDGKPFMNPDGNETWSVPYKGQPYFVSEFGGTWWNPNVKEGDPSWGYGQRPKTLEEFTARFQGLCDALLDNPAMFGYCYTQLTDVFQEQNGIYLFDRSAKFDMARIRAIQQRKAAIEG
jgi:beta-galactosidase/beta-glucuronidase